MVAIIVLVITLTLSLILTRLGTVALVLTGMSEEAARFQARSAFTGVGFTTSESEGIMNHPVRRRVVMALMLFGNAGIATVVATLMISFLLTSRSGRWTQNLLLLAGGLLALWVAASSRWVDRLLSRLFAKTLRRWTGLDVRDYCGLLHLARGYAVLELQVEPGDWLANKTLAELDLPREGVLVLGIQRPDHTYLGAPTGQTEVLPHDTLIIYGPISRVEELDTRRAGRAGVQAHRAAVSEQHQRVEQEEETDQQSGG